MAELERQVGYLTGVVEGVRDEIKESREEVKECLHSIQESFKNHAQDDTKRFSELGKQVAEIRELQNKVKYYIAGAIAATGTLVSGAAWAIKYLS